MREAISFKTHAPYPIVCFNILEALSMRSRKTFTFVFAASTLLTVAAYATPGPQRMIAPTLYGLTEVTEGVYTDDPTKTAQEILLISQSNAAVKAFFGTLEGTPRYVMCTTMMCEKTFGKSNRIAVCYGWHAIHLPPRGVNDLHLGRILLTHERVHSELHKRWGASELWDAKFPTWFDEGLASYLSGDDRLHLEYSDKDIEWISHARRIYSWGSFIQERGWADAYGAATAYVSRIQAKAGEKGLHELIDRTIKGEDFDAVLADLMRDKRS